MTRVHGSKDCPLVECTNRHLGIYVVNWDYKTENVKEDGMEEEREDTTFYSVRLEHKPTLEEIRDIIFAQMNEEAQLSIASGYKYDGKEVWLSSENQFNYKAAYDLATQTQGESLPTTFKFGTVEKPVYHTFETLPELKDFYDGAIAHIRKTLSECWKAKDKVDFKPYEKLLKEV